MTEDDDYLPAFTLPPDDAHPGDIAERVMTMPEHRHLAENEITFGWLMRSEPKVKGGKVELGSVHDVKTMFQGGFKDLGMQLLEGMLGHLPQFIVVLNYEAWRSFNPEKRTALVFHELCHVQQSLDKFGAPKFDKDGLPVYGLVGHDIEAFSSEVSRFGAWTSDIADFLEVANGSISGSSG